MTDSYLYWQHCLGDKGLDSEGLFVSVGGDKEAGLTLAVVKTFCMYFICFHCPPYNLANLYSL